MYNPFDLIPKTIDKSLRDIIIVLVVIQFTAFLILISYLTYEFIKYRRNPKQPLAEEIENNKEKNEETLNKKND